MDILDGGSTLSVDQQRKAIADHCGHFLPDIAAAQAAIAGGGDDGAPKLDTSVERYIFLLGPLMDYLRRTASERSVKQKLGEAFGIELAAASHLLTVALRSQGQPGRPALDDLASASALGQLAARAALRRMHKAALLIARLKVNPDELAWLYSVGGTPWLDLNALPLEPAASRPSTPGCAWSTFCACATVSRLAARPCWSCYACTPAGWMMPTIRSISWPS
jgi:hypothetical protein